MEIDVKSVVNDLGVLENTIWSMIMVVYAKKSRINDV